MRKWLVCAAVIASVLALGGEAAYAQNAQITGIIKDQSGGVVPGVTVRALNQETGLVREEVTDVTGTYRLRALPPGTYTLTAELMGFASIRQIDIPLIIDQTAILDLIMRAAGVTEQLTVTADAPIIDTTRSDVSTAVSTEQIQDLPVASRRWIDLAMLTPGTSQDNIRGFYYRGNVNVGAGTREYSNAFVVDGVNNTWAEMGEARQNFAMDSIREFKVTTSNFKAEYGLATGGLVSVVSKSGTNQFEGSGFLFFRDKSLTAKTYFEDEKPDFKRYQWGGSIGGPIVQNKTHFFFAWERTDEEQFFTVDTLGVWPEYDGLIPSDQYRWNYTAKLDHQLTSNQSVFLRFAQENEYRPALTSGGTSAASAGFDFAVPRDSAVLAHTWVVSDRALNDFRFQYGFSKYEVSPTYSHGSWEPGDFPQERLDACTPAFRYPSLSVGNCNNQMGPETRWQFKNDTSYLLDALGGSHQLKVGVDYNYIEFQADGMGGYSGTWTFPVDRPYDPNDQSTWPTQYTQSLPSYADIPVHHLSVYAQDDFEVADGLTLNLGLRYDLQKGVFNEDIPDLLGRIEDKLGPGFGYPLEIPWHDGVDRRGDSNNFGPRVGFAWDPTNDGRTNVHGAYGMFYENIRTLTNFGELTWPQSQSIVIRNPSFPDPLQGRSRDEFTSSAPPNITVLSNDLVNPYAHHYNVGFTRMVTTDMALTADVTYVRRYSDRDTVDVNLPDEFTRLRPEPQFNRVNFGQPTSDNTYKALLAKFEKRMSNGYQFLVSYTLSKADDDLFTNDLPDVYGFTKVQMPGQADRRHRLVLSGILELPYEFQMSAIADFRSSLPFNTGTPFDLDGDGYTGDLPPDVAPRSGCRDLNLDAINAFRSSRGLPSVSSVSCPGFANLDLRLSRSFRTVGEQRLEFIAQLFNVFNRANFDTPIGGVTSSLFGQSVQLLPNINAPSRQVEFALRYRF
jgi:hypothetical protein